MYFFLFWGFFCFEGGCGKDHRPQKQSDSGHDQYITHRAGESTHALAIKTNKHKKCNHRLSHTHTHTANNQSTGFTPGLRKAIRGLRSAVSHHASFNALKEVTHFCDTVKARKKKTKKLARFFTSLLRKCKNQKVRTFV